MELYLKEHYYDQIANLLNEPNDRTHASLQVDLSLLQQKNFDWFNGILENVQAELPKWNEALLAAQKLIVSEEEGFLDEGYQIKVNCHVRFIHLPPTDPHFKIPFPNIDQIGQFRDVRGTVNRMTQTKLLEIKRDFICSKCHTVVVVEADYALMYRFDVPLCTTSLCKGNMHQKDAEPNPKYCVNYQELKIQEAVSEKNIPPTLIVTLDSDLVDRCQPGDCVTICGTVERRWRSFNETKCEAIITMRAISLVREQNNLFVEINAMSEMMALKGEWLEYLAKYGELGLRDLILKSICPDVYGLYPVKLAILLAICTASDVGDHKSNDGLHQRGQSHILMVGDPGLAKSKLLLSATEIAPRAVHTTGMGCSTAGLTAAAVKEDGEWVLEGGALVLADGGICCIDEFNLMRETDRSSIHEAMEQQTVSMAKAGIVCKLNTRCAILAAANPKNLHAMTEAEGMTSINIGIATPLLSRFDLVFTLKDERIPEWDDKIAFHLLAQVTTGFQDMILKQDAELWLPDKLKKHLAAVSQVRPKITPIASATLGAYYRKCRSDPERDHGRTTIRLLDSLNRLAESHARLLFREEVTVIDVIVIIRLMESTFGFGRIVKPYDIIKEELPLGPDDKEIKCILNILEIVEQSFEQNSKPLTSQGSTSSLSNSQNQSRQNKENNMFSLIQSPTKNLSQNDNKKSQDQTQGEAKVQSFSQVRTQNSTIQNSFGTNLQSSQFKIQSQKLETSKSFQSKNVPTQTVKASNIPSAADMDLDELDEILSFDIDSNSDKKQEKHPEKNKSNTSTQKENQSQHAMSDDEDLVLSQALDELEQSQIVEPVPKILKLDFKVPKRMSLNLSRFKKYSKENAAPPSVATTTSAAPSSNEPPKEIEKLTPPIRNRIFCTPSDDENSQKQTSKISSKTMSILNSFRKENINKNQQSIQQKNVVVSNTKANGSQPKNDSAYDSMDGTNISLPSTDPVSCRKTGKTPAIFSSNILTQNNDDKDDLDFLNSIEL